MLRPRTAPGAACARLGFVPRALYRADPRYQPSPPARGKCRRYVAEDLERYRRRAIAGVRAGRGKRAALPRKPPRASRDLTGAVPAVVTVRASTASGFNPISSTTVVGHSN